MLHLYLFLYLVFFAAAPPPIIGCFWRSFAISHEHIWLSLCASPPTIHLYRSPHQHPPLTFILLLLAVSFHLSLLPRQLCGCQGSLATAPPGKGWMKKVGKGTKASGGVEDEEKVVRGRISQMLLWIINTRFRVLWIWGWFDVFLIICIHTFCAAYLKHSKVPH